jgi:hypothetical protein
MRPAARTGSDEGNDGLTSAERTALATKYRATAGSPVLTADERQALKLLRSMRASRV